MADRYYLAIDIGASSGRHILGWLENGKIRIEEIYRFENKLVRKNGHLCWDLELMEKLGIPTRLFGPLYMPKSVVGPLKPAMAERVGFQTEVILPATHDTGSAVMAVPSTSDDSIYLSSGTWSLMGGERLIPDCTEKSRQHNFTNEGGYHYRYRYLKNIWPCMSAARSAGTATMSSNWMMSLRNWPRNWSAAMPWIKYSSDWTSLMRASTASQPG